MRRPVFPEEFVEVLRYLLERLFVSDLGMVLVIVRTRRRELTINEAEDQHYGNISENEQGLGYIHLGAGADGYVQSESGNSECRSESIGQVSQGCFVIRVFVKCLGVELLQGNRRAGLSGGALCRKDVRGEEAEGTNHRKEGDDASEEDPQIFDVLVLL